MSKLGLVAVLLLLLLGDSASVFAQNVDITGVRFGKNGATTRFVMDVSEPVKPRIFMLANPRRLVIDIPNSNWKSQKTAKASGLVGKYRHGLFSADTYRIVLDLNKAAVIRKSFSLPASKGYSNRYVIDLAESSQSDFLAAVKSSKPQITKTVAQVPSVEPVQKSYDGKRIIVVDAGHGGPDPGTLGRYGSNEKILTLKISREIKRELERTGRYRVYLTRDKDIYIPHRKRFEIAKRMGADLFISVHVDSIANSKVRGGTVYTLNENASDKEAARLAAKENKSDILAGVDLAETNNEVSSILIDLAQRETMNNSAQFAEILVPEMRRQVKMHRRGHRFANFLVLKSPDVPSVLIETGYQTNKQDARMLNSRDGQRRIAKAVSAGVNKYFDLQIALGR
ncbi:N-acetylmuramoyl-L-alanine amidase [Kordiimonas laminariae]|uniref:N-acetylmuramoyl-L-alanine amidase n=1 Tax=Kordiimonas laminariae TaxID=2917717 RepID=UPI001FF20CCB|nr:N-acetylmuramoyl-L-alanine amidase [Kordiimonas laminariae]MCK0069859.1 N-acetylmuramoyl-L-alanine amidase [Kordiimonas laminariae]